MIIAGAVWEKSYIRARAYGEYISETESAGKNEKKT
jgi:hypothetical protein